MHNHDKTEIIFLQIILEQVLILISKSFGKLNKFVEV